MANGIIHCLVERDPVTVIDGMTFDLILGEYYYLISSGSSVEVSTITYHDINFGATRNAIRPTENNPAKVTFDSNSKVLLMIHGSFMIVAWIGLSSFGSFSARFLKKLEVRRELFEKAIWFVIHLISMSLTWLLTVAAVAIIWVDVGTWKTSTHSVVGIITAALCLIQPFTAFFRPAPEDEARPIFNFMHGSVGKLAHFLSGNFIDDILRKHIT